MRFKITHFKTRIAGNSQSIAKICNAEVSDFGLIASVHELIRGSLTLIRLPWEQGKALTQPGEQFPESDHAGFAR